MIVHRSRLLSGGSFGLLVAALVVGAGQAQASPWSGQIGVSTDYMSKGASKTDGDPQIWGRLEAAQGGLYAGGWASNLKVKQDADAEIHLYLGHRRTVGGYSADVSAFFKTFPHARGASDDMVEFRSDVGHNIGPLSGRLRIEWTPDNFGAAKQALWVEARVAWPLSPGNEVSAAIGRRTQNGGSDHVAWNLGLNHALTPRLSADLRWFDTDRHSLSDNHRGRLVAGLTSSF